MNPGTVFGNWTVLGDMPAVPGQKPRTKCRCVCGKVKAVLTHTLVNGRSKSCGCWIKTQHNEIRGKWFRGSEQRRADYAG